MDELVPIDESAALVRISQERDDPYAPLQGRPLQYPREVIERCLFETATRAGNARKARAALVDWEPDLAWPIAETIYGWIKGRFRNRYAEICTSEASVLRETIAQHATGVALRISEAEIDAIRRVQAGIGSANAVEASIILRNLSSSKSLNLDQEGRLRGRATVIVEHRSIEDVTKALVDLGVAVPVDGECEEITD